MGIVIAYCSTQSLVSDNPGVCYLGLTAVILFVRLPCLVLVSGTVVVLSVSCLTAELTLDKLSDHAVYRVTVPECVTFKIVIYIRLY